MRYILSNHIALRSWQLVPYAYYVKGERNAKGLKADEFAFLSSCDGKSELPSPEESPLARRFLEDGFIRRAGDGETLSDWSRPRLYLNRYFPAMNWMITGKCNYNCIHCFNAADNAPLMSEWSMEEADRLLDQARDCGINAFTITGGEPMLHRHFFNILEGIYARGMYVEELNTNGYFIDQQALDRMRAMGCVPLVKISFDGIGYHDWMRAHRGAEETALRAIRLCLTRPILFQTQLCAILRASRYGNVGIMFPMVTGPDELHRLKEALADAEDVLIARGERFGPYRTGVMIETPAAVFMSGELAGEVDFFSIGTNDLTQYLLAMDRQNPNLAPFCDPHHPAVLRAIRQTVERAHQAGCTVGICGELAADEALTEAFLRLGVDELSVAPSRILPLREKIRSLTLG